MAKRGLYRGFSFFKYEQDRTFQVTDVELVKLDLLSHIYTRRGSRIREEDFGSDIPELTFEMLDDETIESLRDDLIEIIEFDPRVELLNLNIDANIDAHVLRAIVTLRYVELDQVDDLILNIRINT